MPREESLYPADWLRIAEEDLARVGRLASEDPKLAGLCLQQAAEKFLKAFLLSHGWKLRRIHDLAALLGDAVQYDRSVEDFRAACQRATDFHVVERYPFIAGSGVTEEDVRSCLEGLEGLFKCIRAKLGK